MAIRRNSQTSVYGSPSIGNSSLKGRNSGYRDEDYNADETDVYDDYDEEIDDNYGDDYNEDQNEDSDAENFFYGEFYEFENNDLDEPQSRAELRRSKRAKRNLRKSARSTTQADLRRASRRSYFTLPEKGKSNWR